MSTKVLPMSSRGQITIPKNLRKKFYVKYFLVKEENGKIVLEPLQTKEEFLADLEADEKKWEKKGGYAFEDVMKESRKIR